MTSENIERCCVKHCMDACINFFKDPDQTTYGIIDLVNNGYAEFFVETGAPPPWGYNTMWAVKVLRAKRSFPQRELSKWDGQTCAMIAGHLECMRFLKNHYKLIVSPLLGQYAATLGLHFFKGFLELTERPVGGGEIRGAIHGKHADVVRFIHDSVGEDVMKLCKGKAVVLLRNPETFEWVLQTIWHEYPHVFDTDSQLWHLNEFLKLPAEKIATSFPSVAAWILSNFATITEQRLHRLAALAHEICKIQKSEITQKMKNIGLLPEIVEYSISEFLWSF